MARVFVVSHMPHNDISDAANFGEITIINHRYVFLDEMPPIPGGGYGMPDSFASNIRAAVDRFNFHADHVLIGGDPYQLSAFMMELGVRHFNAQVRAPIRMLRYERMERRYVSVCHTVPDSIPS